MLSNTHAAQTHTHTPTHRWVWCQSPGSRSVPLPANHKSDSTSLMLHSLQMSESVQLTTPLTSSLHTPHTHIILCVCVCTHAVFINLTSSLGIIGDLHSRSACLLQEFLACVCLHFPECLQTTREKCQRCCYNMGLFYDGFLPGCVPTLRGCSTVWTIDGQNETQEVEQCSACSHEFRVQVPQITVQTMTWIVLISSIKTHKLQFENSLTDISQSLVRCLSSMRRYNFVADVLGVGERAGSVQSLYYPRWET